MDGSQATKTDRGRSVPVSKKLGKIIDGMSHGKPDDLVFPERSRRHWARMLRPIKEALPVMDRPGGGGGWRDFRRTTASLLVQGGVDIYLVSKILGHSDIRTTARHYVQLLRRIPHQQVQQHLCASSTSHLHDSPPWQPAATSPRPGRYVRFTLG